PRRVDRPRLDQRLDDALVEHADVDLLAEVEEVGEAAPGPPGGDDRLHHLLTDVPHSTEAIADCPRTAVLMHRGALPPGPPALPPGPPDRQRASRRGPRDV